MEALKLVHVIVAAVAAFLITIMEHYFPWRQILYKDLPRIPTYTMGVLAIGIPFSVVLLISSTWMNREVLLAFWLICAAAGLGTINSHILDALISHRNRAKESEEREKRLLEMHKGKDQ